MGICLDTNKTNAPSMAWERRSFKIFIDRKIWENTNRYGKKLVLKEGLYRLARLATKKTTSITIIPIGIAYSKIPPNFRGEFCLSFGKPIPINDYSNFTIKDFNKFLNEKMTQEEEKALKNVGRWICNKLLWILIIE